MGAASHEEDGDPVGVATTEDLAWASLSAGQAVSYGSLLRLAKL